MSISFNSAINAYNSAAKIGNITSGNKSTSGGNDVFSALIEKPVQNSIGSLRNAERTAIGNLTKQADITDVVTAVQNAEATLKTVVAVRDRLVSAIQELQKMPI